ncbi:MAG: carboxypeptidase-like regulatory domain-containing protein, partial [Bacteroidetes bacterium]|nr:carboxypeptidase-like regulatory domain-containing protein [Bacteroidota bacterium]
SEVKNIIISHLGYENLIVPIRDLKSNRNVLKIKPAILTLAEVVVFPDSAKHLISMVLNKVRENYGNKAYNMTGFYREYIKKKNRYVGLSEAVVKLYKASYTGLLNDQVQIYKGRKGTDVRKLDTVLFKLQGGPATTMLLDIIKNPTVILDEESLKHYNFQIINTIKIGNKLNYVIEFTQKESVDFPLYDGRYYVDIENLALTAADFSLNVTNPVLASRIFLRKKPVGAKVTPVVAKYAVKYREQDGEWFFNYAKGEVQFKVNWDRKLFNSNYTVMSEIAITDRTEADVQRFKNKDKFKRSQILSEKIGAFTDENYWGEYNLIEPDQSIEIAIRRIKRLMKR